MNPANSEAYLVTAFWLSQMGKFDAAHEVLAEARRNIPFAPEIALEEGRMFLHEGNDNAAYQCFTACIAFAERKAARSDDVRYALRSSLLFKASIDERRSEHASCQDPKY
jgi:predicted negative regulator of RcsB-dependent stress response